MFGKRVGELKRRTAIKRGAPLQRKARLKRGAPSPFRERVKYLHRACVMLRACGFVRAKTFRSVTWTAACEKCGKVGAVVVSHIYGQGAHRAAAFISLNARALCPPCHDWWHANPLLAAEWIRHHLGPAGLDNLAAQVEATKKVNLPHAAALLVTEIRARGLNENSVIPEGTWAP